MPNLRSPEFVRRTTLSMFIVTVGLVACGGGGADSAAHAGGATGTATPEGVFVPTGSLIVARYGQTATLLSSGKVLMAGGFDGENVLASAELYDPGTGTFTLTGNMTAARLAHTAIALSDGLVLVAGGTDSSNTNPTNVLASAELYDPETGRFTATGGLTAARYNLTATLLPSGNVLVAGGTDGATALASAELYDPDTGTFTSTGSLTVARSSHAATSLSDGTVLVTGGYGDGLSPLASAEVYDRVAGAFLPTESMGRARARHTETLLRNGKVLVAGFSPFAELYDSAAGTFADTGTMIQSRVGNSGTLLPDGKVLIAGGSVVHTLDGQTVGPAELYDTGVGTFSATGNMTVVEAAANATLLPNGKVLLAGGYIRTPAQNPDAVDPALAGAELFEE